MIEDQKRTEGNEKTGADTLDQSLDRGYGGGRVRKGARDRAGSVSRPENQGANKFDPQTNATRSAP